MFCTKCGKQIDSEDGFCLNCGQKLKPNAPVKFDNSGFENNYDNVIPAVEICSETSSGPTKDKRKRKNKKAVVVCCIIIIISIIICLQYYLPIILKNNKSSGTKESDFNWSNLSQFDSHGQLSCERIWVVKTQSSWDSAPEKYFAYLDIDGNLIYDWTKLGEPGTETYGWVPFDYANGYAAMIKYDHKPEGGDGSGMLYIINKNGRGITHEKILVYWEKDYNWGMITSTVGHSIKPFFKDFNEDGYFYFYGKVDSQEEGVYYVNTNGDTVRFKLEDSNFYYENVLRRGIYYTEGYFYIKDGYSTSALFDSNGEMVLNIKETCNIDDYRVEVLNNNEIEVYFTGKDEKNYKCIIDFQGNFIEEPQRLE